MAPLGGPCDRLAMRTGRVWPSILSGVLALGACHAEPEDDDGPLPDAGAPNAVSEPDAGPECGPPPPPYGTSLGSRFLPLELVDCEGQPYSFYGEGFCDAAFTILEQQTAWCVPSQQVAAELESEIVGPYGSRGVRVLEVLVQDGELRQADEEDCREWTERYGLSNPVLIDPHWQTDAYFPRDALPALLIVDASGTIRYRQYGRDLVTLKRELDRLLATREP